MTRSLPFGGVNSITWRFPLFARNSIEARSLQSVDSIAATFSWKSLLPILSTMVLFGVAPAFGATFFGFLDFVALYATPNTMAMAVEIAAEMAMLLAVGSSTAFFAAVRFAGALVLAQSVLNRLGSPRER
jgi:hypothetical protein